jgi:hypothetical protein
MDCPPSIAAGVVADRIFRLSGAILGQVSVEDLELIARPLVLVIGIFPAQVTAVGKHGPGQMAGPSAVK